VLRLYDDRTRSVEEITPARPGVVRVACDGDLRSLVVADLIRRVAAQHRLRTIGVWPDVPDAADLNVRPAELAQGDADVHVGATVGRWSLGPRDGLDPLAVRFALLARHYRADADLSRDDLDEAQSALTDRRRQVAGWAESPGRPLSREYVGEAVTALDADLDTPAAFAVLSRMADDPKLPPGAKFETTIKLDMIFGLDLVALVGRR
jgi:hypothetical protein